MPELCLIRLLDAGTGSVRCHANSDDSCQTEIKDTGDKDTAVGLTEAKGARSVICHSGC